MEWITAKNLSDTLHIIFLVMMIYAALVRLTDGNRETMTEKIALGLIAIGAWCQIARSIHPGGTELDLTIMHFGMATWMIMDVFKVKYLAKI